MSIRFCYLLLLLLVALPGCQENEPSPAAENADPTEEAPAEPMKIDGMTALEIMQKVVATYREAETYSDFGEVGPEFVSAIDGVQRQEVIMTFSLVFDRPNRFRIAREELRMDGKGLGAIVACDGEKLEASVSHLEPQRLVTDAPEKATLASVAKDPLLRQALLPRPPRDIFPQLDLLLLEESETPWVLEAPEGLTLLPAKQLSRNNQPAIDCYRVRVSTDAGPHVCWIEKSSFLLLRISIENEEIAQQLFPGQEFFSFVWRFDFYSAAFDAELPDELFRIEPSAEEAKAEVVAAFREPEADEVDPEKDESAAEEQ